MKVVKKDGRIVSYDRQKIVATIENANQEVAVENRASKAEIKSILAYIEDLNKNRILVEDIQEIVESKLNEFNKVELADRYTNFKCDSTPSESNTTKNNTILGIMLNETSRIPVENM
ncbi:MAG: hypothetical protein IKG14_06435 [Clostridia bacterium]|nr:hypothetical protein [Clostridia bacterium]